MADLNSSVLSYSSTDEAESKLFQNRTKDWLRSVLLGKSGFSLTNLKEGKGDATNTKSLTVKAFSVEILGESASRANPRNQPILKIRVTSQVDETETTDYLVVKILDDDNEGYEEELYGALELNFYTQAIPCLLEWSKCRGVDLKLGIPKCYYGKYAHDYEERGQQLPESEEKNTDNGGMKESTTILLLDTMSTLVLEDVCVDGYVPSISKCSLTRDEAHSALHELAKIHALSWAYREITGEDLKTRFHFCENTTTFLTSQIEGIKQTYPKLRGFLATVEDGNELILHLDYLMENLESKLRQIIIPANDVDEKLPVCLLHMDFWTQNLLFRDTRIPGDTSGTGSHSAIIIDWENTMYGYPTNDIACLFATSLSATFREMAVEALLEFYWNSFKETCDKLDVKMTMTFESLQSGYDRSRILPLILVMGSMEVQLDNVEATDKFIEILREVIDANLI